MVLKDQTLLAIPILLSWAAPHFAYFPENFQLPSLEHFWYLMELLELGSVMFELTFCRSHSHMGSS